MLRRLFALVLCFGLTSIVLFAHGEEGVRVKLPDEDAIRYRISARSDFAFAKTGGPIAGFLSAHPEWDMWVNETTGSPHRAWGDGIAIRGFNAINLLNAPAAGRQFVEDNAALLNADPAKLKLLYSDMVDRTVYQKYVQLYHGIEVLHSYVDLRIFDNGRVFLFGSDYHPAITVSAVPTLGIDAARAFSTAGLPSPVPGDRIEGGTLYVLPLAYPGHTDYRLVYNFRVAANADELWDTYVDAHSGEIVWRRNLITFFRHPKAGGPNGKTSIVSGRVMISVYKDSWLLGSSLIPLPNAYVNIAGQEIVTDADGRFSADIGADPNAAVVTRLTGPYARARRADTTSTIKNAFQQTTITPGQELTITWDSTNSAASERSVFYHINQLRNFIRGIDASETLARCDNQMIGVININQECNANWNGTTLNFFRQSASCGNTAEIADVVYHEYGHAVNSFLYGKLGRPLTSGTLGEATADILANMLRDDPRIGIGFMIGGPNQGIIRNSENTRRYPENIVNEIHDDGMILTGAVWDMRKAIGLDAARQLTHKVKYGTPDAPSAGEVFADYFIEMLVADDDDGNLANGTPHSADIIAAFVKHGIPASGIIINHVPIRDQDSVTEPYICQGSAFVSKSIRKDVMTLQTMRVVYTTDNWTSSNSFPLNLNLSTDNFFGDFPAQRAGSIVRYYIEVTDNFGSTVTYPPSAPGSTFLFLVGYLRREFHNGESSEGWKVNSDASTGEWQRVKPIGTWNSQLGQPPDVPYVQPNADHTTGAGKCWVTGNSPIGSELGDNDVDGGQTILTTKQYQVSAMVDPVLRYFRWYSNNSGATPGTDWWTVLISNDGGQSWKEIERTKESDASWSAKIFRLKDLFGTLDSISVQFVAEDAEPGSLVEAAVDDLEILDVNTALDVSDLDPTPGALALAQNYPNPFNPSTSIRYALPRSTSVRLAVYTSTGLLVRELFRGTQSAGTHQATFDASSIPSGVYHCILDADGTRLSKQMVVLK